MTHPIDLYFRRHRHFPRVSIDSGVQKITVEFHPGYVSISSSPPFAGQVYITRSAWFRMLKAALPLTRKYRDLPAEDWDVPARVHEANVQEAALARELRQQKKSRRLDVAAMERQRRRFLAAKARGKAHRERS